MALSSVPNDNFLDWIKFKAFAEDKVNVAKNRISVFDLVGNIVGKGAFSPFLTMSSKDFFHRVVKSRGCVVKD